MADAKSFQVLLKGGSGYAVEADSWEVTQTGGLLTFRRDGERIGLVVISELIAIAETRLGVEGSVSSDESNVQASTTSDAVESNSESREEESSTVDKDQLAMTWSIR